MYKHKLQYTCFMYVCMYVHTCKQKKNESLGKELWDPAHEPHALPSPPVKILPMEAVSRRRFEAPMNDKYIKGIINKYITVYWKHGSNYSPTPCQRSAPNVSCLRDRNVPPLIRILSKMENNRQALRSSQKLGI